MGRKTPVRLEERENFEEREQTKIISVGGLFLQYRVGGKRSKRFTLSVTMEERLKFKCAF